MKAAAVSVVMPVYNGERFLQAAMDSVLTQTLSDLELIVVDDGSTDETPQIVGSYDDPRVVTVTQENAGIARALNAGLSLARGRYLARMDADDVSLPPRLRHQADFLDRHADVAAVGCSYARIDAQGRRVGVTGTLCSPRSLRRALFVHNPLAHGSAMIRTEVLRGLGGYRPGHVPAEDYDMWIRLTAERPVAAVPEVLYEYRVHDANTAVTGQTQAATVLLDQLWRTSSPSTPSWREVSRELKGYARIPAPLGASLAAEYHERHYAIVREAVRRRRWDVVSRFAATAPRFVAGHRWRRVRP